MDEMDRSRTEDLNRSNGPLRTSQRFYRIDRRDIGFLRFIIEAYDGMAVLTTRDAPRGIVSVTIAPGCETIVTDVITSLSESGEIYIEPLAAEDSANCLQGCACTSFT